jgi:hypothetical protein
MLSVKKKRRSSVRGERRNMLSMEEGQSEYSVRGERRNVLGIEEEQSEYSVSSARAAADTR